MLHVQFVTLSKPEALDALLEAMPENPTKDEALEAVVRCWGGKMIYVPKGSKHGKRAERKVEQEGA